MQPSDYFSVVEKLYVAYFGRPADPLGLQYWSQTLAAGNAPTTSEGFVEASAGNSAVRDVLAGFDTSPESKFFYANDSVDAQVKQIYQNVLGRDAEPAGVAYWASEINAGRLKLANASFVILQAAEKDTAGDGLSVAAKVAVATAYTQSLDTPAEISAYSNAAAAAQARALLATVTKDTNTATFQSGIDASIAGLGKAPAPAPAPASGGGAVDTVPPVLAITSSASMLQTGQTATVTFTFSEDTGSSFTDSDVSVSGGTLSALSGTGLVRTATFTATDSTSLSTGAKISVAPSSFHDLAGNTGDAATAPSLGIATVSNKLLFVGNSATFARVDPVMSYNTYNAVTNPGGVHDLTSPDQGGTFANVTGSNLYEAHNWGGVPGLVDKFAQQVGLNYDTSISARNAATLGGQYLNSSPAGWDMRGNIASQKWDMVVLQDQTDEPLPGGTGSITFAAGSSTATLIVTPKVDATKEYDETLALTLASAAGYRVGTTSAVTTTILNDDPTAPTTNPALPTVTLAANPGAVLEDGHSNMVFTFTRTGPTTSDLVVNFTPTRDGTSPSVASPVSASTDVELYSASTGNLVSSGSGAAARFSSGGGFAQDTDVGVNTTTGSVSFSGSGSGSITIKAGQTSASVTFDPKADSNVELDESIRFALIHPTSGADYNLGTLGTVTGTIINDDFAAGTDTSLPNITLGLGSASGVYEDAGQNLVYTFTRSGSTTSALTVNFAEDGTASYFSGSPADSDFSLSTTGATGATLTATASKNADLVSFQKYANLIESYIHTGAADTTTKPGTTIAANPNADASTDVYLYATWARPDMVSGAFDMTTDGTTLTSGPNAGADAGTGNITRTDTQASGYYLTLEAMTTDLQNAYANLATANSAFKGVAPVGKAFMAAVLDNLAVRDPYTDTFTSSVGTGKLDLWFDDNLHASKYGSYLAGLTLFETLTGMDAQVLGAADKVASDLGIDAATAVALQKVASATLGFNQALQWSGPGIVKDLAGANTNTTLATAGAFSFADGTYTAHTVSVQAQAGNLGTLAAVVRSDGSSGQVNWVYTVNDQVVDPLLHGGDQRTDRFTVSLDDGHGHVSTEVVAVKLLGQADI
ncbi:MAG: Ig-like domain-containing protein [Pseudomonadota bacterium]